MRMLRSSFIYGSVAAVAAPAIVRAAAPLRLIVTETEVPLVPNSVAWLALSLGYFQRSGVAVELVKVQQTPSAVAALRAGEGDMANIGTDTTVQLVGRGQMDIHGVISPDKALPFAIAATKTIAKPGDLAGKRFGVARIGSVDYEMTRVVLAKLGVDPDKLSYLAVGQPATRAQALLAGQIDATTISLGIIATLPDRNAINVVVDQPTFHHSAPFVSKITVVPTDVAKNRKAEVGAAVRALIVASRDFARNPKHWVDAMASARPDVPRPQLETLAAAYRTDWSVNGGLNTDSLRFTQDALYRSPEFTDVRRLALGDWVDTSYVDAVLKTTGIDAGADAPTR